MRKIPINIKIGSMAIGVLDILVGMFFMPFLFLWGYIIFINACLYFIFGVMVLFKKLYLKLLLYGIIPFTILHAATLTILSRNHDGSNYHRMTISVLLMWLLPLLFICAVNVVFFTRYKVQEQFIKD